MAVTSKSGANAKARQHPEFVAVVVFLAVLAAAYHALFGTPATPPAVAGPPPIDEPPAAGDNATALVVAGVGPQGWIRPVNAPIWGGFRAKNPSDRDHNGVDLGAKKGTPVRAAAAGRVVRVRCNLNGSSWEPTDPRSAGCDQDGQWPTTGCGWYVDIRHAGDIYTRYCHLLRKPDVTVGQDVQAGQVIAVSGDSGGSGEPHLHFEVHLGGEDYASGVDPITFMADHGAPLGTN